MSIVVDGDTAVGVYIGAISVVRVYHGDSRIFPPYAPGEGFTGTITVGDLAGALFGYIDGTIGALSYSGADPIAAFYWSAGDISMAFFNGPGGVVISGGSYELEEGDPGSWAFTGPDTGDPLPISGTIDFTYFPAAP